MVVVAACSDADAMSLARSLLPDASCEVRRARTALVFVDPWQRIGPTAVRVGMAPTSSRVAVSDDEIILERGPSWTAPIYYRTDTCVASSHVTPLLRAGDSVDVGRVAAIAGYALHQGETRTVYDRIKVVRPFETVTLSDAGRSSARRAPPRLDPVPNAPIEELAEELRRKFLGAVQRAIGEHRVALLLSGGLDSASVLAAILATRGARPDDILLTLDFEARHSDGPSLRALEAHYGISVLRVQPSAAPTHDALLMDSVPSRHPADPIDFAMAREARDRGADILVSGAGGDQLFGGYFAPATLAALADGDWRGAYHAFRARLPYDVPLRTRARHAATSFVGSYLPRPVRDLRARRAARDLPPWTGPLLRQERLRALRADAAPRPASDRQGRFQEICLSPHESEFGAELRAQNDHAFGIPRVDPIYDEDLVRFLTGLPQQALFAGGMYRGLLRRALRGLLPEIVRARTSKSEFEPAIADAVEPFERFEPLLSFESLGRAGIIRPDEFRRYLAPMFAAPRSPEAGPIWPPFWSALAAEAFLRGRG